MSEEWQVDIESRLIHQEDGLDQLNAVITAQQLEIEELKRTCKLLFDKLTELEEQPQTGAVKETKPPHY